MTALADDGTPTGKYSDRPNHAVGDLHCRRLAVRPVLHVSVCAGRARRNSYGSTACDPASSYRHVCVLWVDASATRKR